MHGGARAGLEVFLVGRRPRLAEMHLAVDHARQHVQGPCSRTRRPAAARARSPYRAMRPAVTPTVPDAYAVLVHDGAALEESGRRFPVYWVLLLERSYGPSWRSR